MTPRPLRFLHVVRVFAFNKVSLIKSPPAPARSMYFIGSSRDDAFFPYGSGPVHYLDREYGDDEMVPVRLIHSLAKHLKLKRETFWADAAALEFVVQNETQSVRKR